MGSGNYKGVKAGAIASGFFVAASSFLVLYLVAALLVARVIASMARALDDDCTLFGQ